MAETDVVGFVIDYLTRLVTEEANLLRSVHSQVLGIKLELESIRCFLKDADKKAESEVNTSTTSHGVKAWVKQLREVSFRIEEVQDMVLTPLVKDVQQHLRTAVSWYDPRKGDLYQDETEVVGIESSRAKLIFWLLDEQQSQRTVISVVGMGGLSKTTLAKQVYDSVKEKFDCHAWIAVSHSYQKEDLLKNVIKKFCQGKKEPVPEGIEAMDEEALTNKLREYLRQKRYVVIFDDVWNENFWGDIEHALLDNENSARIVITSRNIEVAHFCRISSFVYVHKMQPLPPEKAWELFCRRVFKFEPEGQCPTDLLKLSHKIVNKCHGVSLLL